MTDYLHIVCLDAPAPPDYGGAIDMYYKIKALHDIGKKVILHYFDYRPTRNADALAAYCSQIFAYRRKTFWEAPPLSRPFIIGSRINEALIDRLNGDRHPVLLEGLHCAGIVPFIQDQERVVLRMHNEEASYYQHLAKTERSRLKRLHFTRESRLLKLHQQTMDKSTALACLSANDSEVLQHKFGFKQVFFIPCFVPWQQLTCFNGSGKFCLYHGNLSVPENREAAAWLVREVFSKTAAPFVVAGKGIPKVLKDAGSRYRNISFVEDPSIAEIDRLVQEAHVNVLPSLNNTGVKLKLLNALLNGRHCLTNTKGIEGSRIEQGVFIKDLATDWIGTIEILMEKDFTSTDREMRIPVLSLYNNLENAKKLSALWSRCR